MGPGSAAAQEARPVALVRTAARLACLLTAARQRLGVAGGERQVRHEDRSLAFGPRPAAEQQRVKLRQVFALDEELIEGLMATIGRRCGHDDLAITGQRQPPRTLALVV